MTRDAYERARRYRVDEVRRADARAGIPAFIDARPALDHIAALRAAGLTLTQIEHRSGVAHGTVRALLTGRTRRLRPRSAAALLAVTADPADPDIDDPQTWVSALGTARRLRALQADGWSGTVLGVRLGYPPEGATSRVWRLVRSDRCSARLAAAVTVLYDDLAGTRGPSERTASRFRGEPGADRWRDADLDRPDAMPMRRPRPIRRPPTVDPMVVDRAVGGERVRMSAAETAEAIARLTAAGRSIAETAEALGVTGRTVTRYRRRERAA